MERDNNGIIFSAVIPLILDDSEKKKKKQELFKKIRQRREFSR